MAEVKSGKEPHAVFVPYLTPSHLYPLVDAARLFAANGVKVTIITTPFNASAIQQSVNYSIGLGHDVSILTIKFPSAELGLPEGVETFSAVTSIDNLIKVYQGIDLLKKPMEDLILSLSPSCIFSDMFYPWTVDLAEKLNIPRLVYHPNNCMSNVAFHNMGKYAPQKNVNSDSESFLIPGLPNKIEMKRSQLEDIWKTESAYFAELNKEITVLDATRRSYALVHDAVYELEPAYADLYQKFRGKRPHTIGPLFLLSNREAAYATPEKINPDDHNETSQNLKSGDATAASCLSWLDSQEPGKVLFICFGGMAVFPDSQLRNIAIALEASGHPFVWVIRGKENDDQGLSWLPDGFEEKFIKSQKGIIVTGWAPQVTILNHPAIGGFMTHCGWNSLMEAITAGVPVITWPLFAETFYNEKYLQVLGFGVSVGAEFWNQTPIVQSLVESKKIEEGIKRLMDDSEESRKIRDRVKEGSALIKAAVKEGGSSYENLMDLIQGIKAWPFQMNN